MDPRQEEAGRKKSVADAGGREARGGGTSHGEGVGPGWAPGAPEGWGFLRRGWLAFRLLPAAAPALVLATATPLLVAYLGSQVLRDAVRGAARQVAPWGQAADLALAMPLLIAWAVTVKLIGLRRLRGARDPWPWAFYLRRCREAVFGGAALALVLWGLVEAGHASGLGSAARGDVGVLFLGLFFAHRVGAYTLAALVADADTTLPRAVAESWRLTAPSRPRLFFSGLVVAAAAAVYPYLFGLTPAYLAVELTGRSPFFGTPLQPAFLLCCGGYAAGSIAGQLHWLTQYLAVRKDLR